MIRVRIKIYGDVHGVGFRNFVHRNAEKLGVNGWAKNMPDGTVEAVFEGEKEYVESLVQLCEKGPSSGYVKKMDKTEERYRNEFKDFKIL